MDPITLGIAMMFGWGIPQVLQKAADAAMQPAIELAFDKIKSLFGEDAQKEAFANAVNAAIQQALVESAATDMQRMQFENALTRLAFPGQEKLREQVLASMCLIAKPDDADLVAPELPRALGMTDALRPELARFLFYLRRALATLPELKPLLDVAHDQNMENAMRLQLAYLANVSATVSVEQGRRVMNVVVRDADWRPTAYLNALKEEFSRLKLGLFDTRLLQSGQQPVTLDQIYTDLNVETMVRLTEQELKERERDFMRREQEQRRMTALEAVSVVNEPRVVLKGAPGSGKSTFVNFLAYSLVQEQLPHEATEGLARLKGWTRGALIPVRVVLREFVEWADEHARTHAAAETLWEYIAHVTKALGYDYECAPMKKHLQKHGGIVLLDGLDEVRDADERRVFVKHAIEKFAGANKELQLVVTCRPYAYENPAWQLEDFASHTLAPFDENQIRDFARLWYAVIGPREGLSAVEVESKTTELLDAIQAREQLQVLAEQPLLLTLMAALNVHGKLPEDRSDLYDKTVELLLDEWQKGKDGGLKRFGIALPKLQAVLAQVAYNAHVRQGSDRAARKHDAVANIAREDLRDALAPEVGGVDNADKLIAYMQTRAGLLLPQGQRTYTFPHRSFQEFMAASHALNSREFPNDLIALVRQDAAWWREVYLFAAGRIAPNKYPSAVDLIDKLWGNHVALSETAASDAHHVTRVLLASQAATDIQLHHNAHKYDEYRHTLQHLQEWLTAILDAHSVETPRRVEAGVLLGKLGDPRPGVNANDFVFCEIPAGEFIMGSKQGDEGAFRDEYPQFRYAIPHAYYIARYPVTNAQFDAFVDAPDGYRNDAWWTQTGLKWRGARTRNERYGGVFNLSNHPVVGVTWYEAAAFCKWLNEQLQLADYRLQIFDPLARMLREDKNHKSKIINQKYTVRLASEPEWEYAARGTDGRAYPWGGELTPEHANYADTKINATSAVGAFPLGTSPFGVLDLSGNVWEWTRSRWGKDFSEPDFKYPYDTKDGREDIESTDLRVLRGGAFSYVSGYVRCALRNRLDPDLRGSGQGFRVCVSPV